MFHNTLRDMQIKITMRYLFTPIKMAIIKQTKKKKKGSNNFWSDVEKLEPLHIADSNVKFSNSHETVWMFLKKLNTE